MLDPPLHLSALEFKTRLPGGISKPPLIIATDNAGEIHKVVLKFRHTGTTGNTFGPTSLACELVCSILARTLGLSVPNYSIVKVDPNLSHLIPDAETKDLFIRNAGDNFGSQFHPDCMGWQSGVKGLSRAVLLTLEGILSFDTAVINGDRKCAKPNLLWTGSEFFLIDHSLAFPTHSHDCMQIEELFRKGPIFDDKQITSHCAFANIHKKQLEFKDLVATWETKITDSLLSEMRALIPTSWETKQGDLDNIFWLLSNRTTLENVTLLLRRVVQ